MDEPATSSVVYSVLRPCRFHGFTLIEMLVAVAIAAILTSLAVPSLAQFAGSLQLSSASNTLLSSLLFARQEAIKRNSRVVLCKSADGIQCATSGGWEQGWLVFHDVNNNSLREETEPVIQYQMPLAGSLRMTGNATVASYIAFVPTGGTRLVGGGFQAGTLTLCRASGSSGDARQIILNAAGRPRVQKASMPSCD